MATANHTPAQVTFKTVADFPNSMVGDDGSVWQFDGQVWAKVTPRPDPQGYLHVTIFYGRVRRNTSVHRLVLETFVGPCPEGMEACHAPDYEPANNRLCNLRWDTPKANSADKKLYGFRRHAKPKVPRAAKVPDEVLADGLGAFEWRPRRLYKADIREIKNAYVSGFRPEKIAEIHEISVFQVCSVLGIAAEQNPNEIPKPEVDIYVRKNRFRAGVIYLGVRFEAGWWDTKDEAVKASNQKKQEIEENYIHIRRT